MPSLIRLLCLPLMVALALTSTACRSRSARADAARALEAQAAPVAVHFFLVQGGLLTDAEFIELDDLLRNRALTVREGTSPKGVLLRGKSVVTPGTSRAFEFHQREMLARSWPEPVRGSGNIAIESADSSRAVLVIEGTFESTRPLAAGANSWVLSGKVAPRFKEAAVFTFGSALEGPDAMNRRAELTTRHELMLYVISEPPDSNAL